MNLKIFWEYVRKEPKQDNLYDLIEPYIGYTVTNFFEYEVQEGEDMRIDLIFQNMYSMEPNEVGKYLGEIDIILNINNIHNPLNIQKGMKLKYPDFSEFDSFRITESEFRKKNNNLTRKLVVPNVSRKIDPKRKEYTDNGFSFPPTVQKTPRDPVSIQNGNFYIGGV
jgi:hypothetical protein